MEEFNKKEITPMVKWTENLLFTTKLEIKFPNVIFQMASL